MPLATHNVHLYVSFVAEQPLGTCHTVVHMLAPEAVGGDQVSMIPDLMVLLWRVCRHCDVSHMLVSQFYDRA